MSSKLYPVLDLAEKMASEEQDGKIPLELVPPLPGVRRSHEDSYDRAQFYSADSGKRNVWILS